MKLTIEQNASVSEPEITVRYNNMDPRLESLIRQIKLYGITITAVKDGRSHLVLPDDIFYFETVDERTWLYQKEEVYECTRKLNELEEILHDTSFVRINRTCLLNIMVVESVRPLLGRRLEALLDNGERLIVNRHYVPEFKAEFGLEDTYL